MTKEKDWWDVPKPRDDRAAETAHKNLVRELDKALAGVDLRESDIKKTVNNYLENRAFESRPMRAISPDQIIAQPPSPSYRPGRPAVIPYAKENPMRFFGEDWQDRRNQKAAGDRQDRSSGPDMD